MRRVDDAADDLLALRQILGVTGELMPDEQCEDAVGGGAAGAVVAAGTGLGRQPRRRAAQRFQHRATRVVHRQYEVGQAYGGVTIAGLAGDEVRQHQPGVVVVRRARPAADGVRLLQLRGRVAKLVHLLSEAFDGAACEALGVAAVGAGVGVGVVVRMPEQPAVVRRLVRLGVVKVDVNGVVGAGQAFGEAVEFAGAEELHQERRDAVVLVVVVRDQRRRAFVGRRLVVAVEVAVVPPAVLVDALALGRKGVWPDEAEVGEFARQGVGVARAGREVRHRPARGVPLRRRRDVQRAAAPRHRLRGDGVAAVGDVENVRLLLAALQLVRPRLLREQAQRDAVGRHAERLGEVLPELR